MRSWFPCCCRRTPCFWTYSVRPAYLNWIADVEGVCDCTIDGETGQLTYNAGSDPPTYTGLVLSTCADAGGSGASLDWTMTYLCLPSEPYAAMLASWLLFSHCRIAGVDGILNQYLQLVSLTYLPVFQAVFRGRIYEGAERRCKCVPEAPPSDTPGPLITFTLTAP